MGKIDFFETGFLIRIEYFGGFNHNGHTFPRPFKFAIDVDQLDV